MTFPKKAAGISDLILTIQTGLKKKPLFDISVIVGLHHRHVAKGAKRPPSSDLI